jgi:hypothetical protein
MKTIERNSLKKGDEVIVKSTFGNGHTASFSKAKVTVVKEDAVYVDLPALKSLKINWSKIYGSDKGYYTYSAGRQYYSLITEEEAEEIRVTEAKEKADIAYIHDSKLKLNNAIRYMKADEMEKIMAVVKELGYEVVER